MKKGYLGIFLTIICVALLGCNSTELKREPKSGFQYQVMREWNPCEVESGLGMFIVLHENQENLTESSIKDFLKNFGINHDLVILEIFLSEEAYYEGFSGSEEGDQILKKDWLLTYEKDLNAECNEEKIHRIDWVQQEGKFQEKYLGRTEL